MPIVCVNRPNRTRRRVFTARDLERISRYAKNEGESSENILASIAVGTDNVVLLCGASKALDALLDIIGYIADAETLGMTLAGIELSIRVLRQYGMRIPILNKFVGLIVAILELARQITGAILALVTAVDGIKEMRDELKESCAIAEKRVKALLEESLFN